MGQSSKFAAPLRAIQFFELAFVILLLNAVIGGALHAHAAGLMRQKQLSFGGIIDIGVIFSLLQLVGIGGSVLLMLGAERLTHAPKEARVISFAQAMLSLFAVSLVLHLVSPYIPRLLADGTSLAALGPILALSGFVQMGLDLAALVVLCEAVLRLRRYAAPNNPAVVSNEPVMRGGLIGLLTARFVIGGISPSLGGAMASFGLPFDWVMYLIRLPFFVGLYVVLLWLLRRTEQLFLGDGPAALGSRDA